MSESIDGCPICSGMQTTTWILTHLRPPVTVMSCEEHANENIIVLLATLLNVDGGWLYGVIADAVNLAANEHDANEAADDEAAELDIEVPPETPGPETLGPAASQPHGRSRKAARPKPSLEVATDEVQGA